MIFQLEESGDTILKKNWSLEEFNGQKTIPQLVVMCIGPLPLLHTL
jgi:hypothetical protein